MSDNSTGTILRVKLPVSGSDSASPSYEWVEVPSLRGSSIYTLPAEPTSREIQAGDTTYVQSGYILKVVDERKKQADPSYEHDDYTLWNGIDGAGSVTSVDSQTVTPGTTNIAIDAVSYGRAQTALTSNQQSQARSNINAQVAGNYIVSPTNKSVNQFLQYLGNNNWATANVQVLPSSATVGMLMKNSSSLDDLTWVPALSTTEIDNILAD